MPTSIKPNQPPLTPKKDTEPRIRVLYHRPENNLTMFFDTLATIDQKSQLAKLNETSIDDNRGGRIELNQDNIHNK